MSDTIALLEKYMMLAIQEAEISLRQGSHGFGTVIIRNDRVISIEHDTEGEDPTCHAELKAIRKASSAIGKDLSACTLVSTYEPCRGCAEAIVWSRITQVAYGYGIADATDADRDRTEITCEEVFAISGAGIRIHKGIRKEECAVLYDSRVRNEIRKLRNASDQELIDYDTESKMKRLEWYSRADVLNKESSTDPLQRAYQLLLKKLGITEAEAPITCRDTDRIVFHSMNYCPTLEACKILQLDTVKICRLYNEGATQELIRQIDPKLMFTRNYDRLRPNADYCEEVIAYCE